MIINNVPFVTQLGPGAWKKKTDCGPSCTMHFLYVYEGISLNPDDFYSYMDVPNDSGTNGGQLRDFLKDFEIETTVLYGLTVKDLKRLTGDKKLSIWLIAYKPLTDAGLVQYKGDFTHWVTVVGYDSENIYINDPYRKDGKTYIPIPIDVFAKASYGTAVYANKPVPEGEPMPPESKTHRVIAGCKTLNVRLGPSMSYKAVGQLGEFEEVNAVAIDTAQDWLQIRGPRLFGFSYKPYLEAIAPVQEDPVTTPTEKEIRLKVYEELQDLLTKEIERVKAE